MRPSIAHEVTPLLLVSIPLNHLMVEKLEKFIAHEITLLLSVLIPLNHLMEEKLEKFHGLNFKRWGNKLMFYLTTLNLARFLIKEALDQYETE